LAQGLQLELLEEKSARLVESERLQDQLRHLELRCNDASATTASSTRSDEVVRHLEEELSAQRTGFQQELEEELGALQRARSCEAQRLETTLRRRLSSLVAKLAGVTNNDAKGFQEAWESLRQLSKRLEDHPAKAKGRGVGLPMYEDSRIAELEEVASQWQADATAEATLRRKAERDVEEALRAFSVERARGVEVTKRLDQVSAAEGSLLAERDAEIGRAEAKIALLREELQSRDELRSCSKARVPSPPLRGIVGASLLLPRLPSCCSVEAGGGLQWGCRGEQNYPEEEEYEQTGDRENDQREERKEEKEEEEEELEDEEEDEDEDEEEHRQVDVEEELNVEETAEQERETAEDAEEEEEQAEKAQRQTAGVDHKVWGKHCRPGWQSGDVSATSPLASSMLHSVDPSPVGAYPPSPPPCAYASAVDALVATEPRNGEVGSTMPALPPDCGADATMTSDMGREAPLSSPRPIATAIETPRSANDEARDPELWDLFQHAEQLCEAQRHAESVPLLHNVLAVLRSRSDTASGTASTGTLEAEVLAYLGVATQSLGRIEEAVEAYTGAVERDPLLHVCHANLSSLLSYLEDHERARKHLDIALRLDPGNATYVELDEQLRAALDEAGW